MNKHNLIRIGALLQLKFDLPGNYEIVEAFPSSYHRYRVPIWSPVPGSSLTYPQGDDEIELHRFAFNKDNKESIFAGYSYRAKTLVIQEPE